MVAERDQHLVVAPSLWVVRWAHLVPPGGAVLDVAAGGGRHTRYFAGLGHPVLAIDRDVAALDRDLAGVAALEADLEDGSPWPLPGRTFAAVIVTNYLWRPILPFVVASVAPGGALIYETFARGNERFGKPSNPAFLLEPGELLEAVRGQLTVRAYEHGEDDVPKRAMRQRIAAVRPEL
ncbi:MAG TPA: class I SAM-dependent methyltransferase [Candidatus Cybelea sp.]|nr:class I SAM-dependent methyltransferase [Candidatus Cybelea sp.]